MQDQQSLSVPLPEDPFARLPHPRRTGWRRRRATPYEAVAGLCLLLMVPLVLFHLPVCCDFGQHASAVERIKADPLHPANPLLDLPGEGSPYYTPYTVGAGLLARLIGLSGWQMLSIFAVLNLVLLLTGINAFTRTLTARPWAPVLALGGFVLLWGSHPVVWSGYLSLQSLMRGISYPSAFAIGLTLHLWSLTARAVRVGEGGTSGTARPLPHLRIGLLGSVILLSHPITAMAAAIGVLSLVAGWQRRWSWAVAARWGLTAAAVLGPALLWPYYDVFGLVGDPTVDRLHEPLYRDPLHWYGLALVGLPALLARLRRDPARGAPGSWAPDPLVLMFAVDCAVAAYGWVTGQYTYGRIFAALLLPLQFALAVDLAEPRPWTRWRRGLAASAAAAGCLGLFAQLATVTTILPARTVPDRVVEHLPHIPLWPSYDWAGTRVPPGDVVLSDRRKPIRIMPAYGAFVVAAPWPDPTVPAAHRATRWRDTRAFLRPKTPERERERIIRRYRVRWVLLGKEQPVPQGARYRVVAQNPRTGERLVRVGR